MRDTPYPQEDNEGWYDESRLRLTLQRDLVREVVRKE